MTATDTAPGAPAPAWLTALTVILATLATAFLGAAVSAGSRDAWYSALDKPAGTPPDIAFAIVWPVLYALMAIGAIIVAVRGGGWWKSSGALGLFFAQLIPNLGWSVAFFGFRQPELSMVILVALWLMVLAMIIAFARHSWLAALLQLPYFGWVIFAGYLNAGIIWLN